MQLNVANLFFLGGATIVMLVIRYYYYYRCLAFHLSLVENPGRFTWVRLQQPQEQRYPLLTVRAVFSCVQTKGMAANAWDL